MRVLGTAVDLQLGQLLCSQGVLRKHALDGLLHCLNRVLLKKFGVGNGLQTAREARVAVSALVFELGAGQGNLLGVDDDDVIAHVHVGGEGSLVLAAQQGCGLDGEATEYNV
ncbi:hypothetical protein D9M71_753430 [compost metagenome]